MVTLSETIILWYLPTAAGFQSKILCPNFMIAHAKGRYHLLKELEKLTHSLSKKSAAANNVTTKHKKQWQMLQSLNKQVRQIIRT